MSLNHRWLEIRHHPFEDGTPRHCLVRVKIPDHMGSVVDSLLEESVCEIDGGFNYYQIYPVSSDHKQDIADLFDTLGITGSIWVEYFIRSHRVYWT